jgi:phage-related minor tail protein
MGLLAGRFADGGYYSGPGPALVGERGPEMFNPRGSGYFTSNDDLAHGRGGGDVHLHVTYNGATTADFNPRTTLQHARQLHRHLQTAGQVR